MAANRRLPSWTWPLVIIVVAVLAGNAMYTTGLANNNPIAWTSGIAHSLCRITCGRPMIDPNVGYITQPLGHLSAMDILHGHVPWWNYFEGLGQPLAGEMQAASLFPLTLVFALPNGLYLFHVGLEIIAGISTYFLGRRLGMAPSVATGIGVVFALNGTFAWLGNATLNPVPFLPMLLLGIEMIYDGVADRARGGWYVVAIALALSLYAGFPETAFLDGLLALVWAAVRLASVQRERRLLAVRRLALGGGVGILLSLPIVVAFVDFLHVANIGSHVGAVDGTAVLPNQALPMFLDPYVYGTILSNHNVVNAWGSIGGYLLAGSSTLAILGLFGRRLRPLRIALGAWMLLGGLAMFNVAHVRPLWNLIPYVKQIAVSRYMMPSLEMVVVVLAGLAITDLATSGAARRLFFVTTGVGLALTIWSALAAAPNNAGVVLAHRTRIIFMGLDALPFIAIGLILIVGFFSSHRIAPTLFAIVLAGEALVFFFVPTAEAAKVVTVDQAPITYLQQHLGEARFLDFAVLYPNWGSQYSLNSLSAIDLPFPAAFANLISTELNPTLVPARQFMVSGGMAGVREQEHAFVTHLAAYEATGVRYLLFPSVAPPSKALVHLGIKLVFADFRAHIYELPTTTPFFSSPTSGCRVSSTAVDVATATCSSAGTLVRSELMMPGWHASVNGHSVPITTTDGVYQTVALPSGTSTITYSFLPPHEEAALAGFAIGVLALFLVPAWTRRRRGRHARP